MRIPVVRGFEMGVQGACHHRLQLGEQPDVFALHLWRVHNSLPTMPKCGETVHAPADSNRSPAMLAHRAGAPRTARRAADESR
ncbi:hypothetical protein GCM10010424_47310 [Streptomyces lienomycini]